MSEYKNTKRLYFLMLGAQLWIPSHKIVMENMKLIKTGVDFTPKGEKT